MRGSWKAVGAILLGVALAAGTAAAQAPAKKKVEKKRPPKVEKLACKLGTEDQHARIAVVLHDGKVNRFAYYSKWKPRTCSMDVERGDAFSKWEDTGNVTVVTLIENTGAFLIDHERNQFKFIFREIDRMRYCGMEGKVSGTLTIFRGKEQCSLEGVMERDGAPSPEADAGKVPPQPAAPAAAADLGRKTAPEKDPAVATDAGKKPVPEKEPAAK